MTDHDTPNPTAEDAAPAAAVAQKLSEKDPAELLRSLFWSRRALTDSLAGPLLFALMNARYGLIPAAIAAGTAGVLTALYRVARKHDARQALFGLIGISVAVIIALLTNRPSSYFVPGTIISAAVGLLSLITAIAGFPMTSLLAQAIQRRPAEWYQQKDVVRSHQVVTIAWSFVMFARAGYRAYLIANGRTTALGIASVVLGYPLTAVFAGASILFLRARGHAGREPAPAGDA